MEGAINSLKADKLLDGSKLRKYNSFTQGNENSFHRFVANISYNNTDSKMIE